MESENRLKYCPPISMCILCQCTWDLPGHFLQDIREHGSGALPQTPWGGRNWGGHHHQDDGWGKESSQSKTSTLILSFGKDSLQWRLQKTFSTQTPVPKFPMHTKSINRIQWSSGSWDEESGRGDSGEKRRTETRSSKHELFPVSQTCVWSFCSAHLWNIP